MNVCILSSWYYMLVRVVNWHHSILCWGWDNKHKAVWRRT